MFFLKTQRATLADIIILYQCTKNIDDVIYSSCGIEYERLKLVVMCHFLPFYASPPKNPTNEIFEKIIQIAGYIIRLPMCTKKLYGVQFLRYRVRQTMFCHLSYFSPFYPQTTQKNDIL